MIAAARATSAIAQALSRFDRDRLVGFAKVAINLRDIAEPEADGAGAQDEPCGWFKGRRDALIADPGGCQRDGREHELYV